MFRASPIFGGPLPPGVRLACLCAYVILLPVVVFLTLRPGEPRRPHPVQAEPDFTRHPAYRAALATARAGRYPEAAEAFAVLARTEARSSAGAWSRYQEAICYRAAGREREAEKTFRRVAAEYPELHVATLAREAVDALPGVARDSRPTVSEPDPHCGPKCLLYVCRQQRVTATLEELVRVCRPGRGGTTLADLARAARANGLKAEGWHLAPEELETLSVPAILWVDRNHYLGADGRRGQRRGCYRPLLRPRRSGCRRVDPVLTLRPPPPLGRLCPGPREANGFPTSASGVGSG